MVTLYYSTYFAKPGDDIFSCHLSKIPDEFKKKILAYRRWEDRVASLYGKLLLMRGLHDLEIKVSLSDLKYTPFGRPFIENQPDFNISHSGNMVACAFISSGKVGLDVEEIKEIELRDFQEQFTQREWEMIGSKEDQYKQFYRFWTIKEAVIKAKGQGLNIPLKQVDASESPIKVGKEQWFIKKIDILNQYQIHLASEKEIETDPQVVEVKF